MGIWTLVWAETRFPRTLGVRESMTRAYG